MNLSKSQVRTWIPWAIFLVLVLGAVEDVVFTRFVHYHSQNRALQPSDYDIQVVTAADYQALSDPAQTTVHLSDDTVLTKAAAWDSTTFNPVRSGAMFARVTTKGTAHILDRTLPKTILVLVLGIVGFIVTWPRACKTDVERRATEPNATN